MARVPADRHGLTQRSPSGVRPASWHRTVRSHVQEHAVPSPILWFGVVAETKTHNTNEKGVRGAEEGWDPQEYRRVLMGPQARDQETIAGRSPDTASLSSSQGALMDWQLSSAGSRAIVAMAGPVEGWNSRRIAIFSRAQIYSTLPTDESIERANASSSASMLPLFLGRASRNKDGVRGSGYYGLSATRPFLVAQR